MLKIITTLTFFLIGILAKGQEIENRNINSFSKIKVKNGIELVYTTSNSELVQIESTSKEVTKKVITTVKGNTLSIYLSSPVTETVKVYVASKNITLFEADTNAKISLTNAINVDNITLNLKSGARFSGNIKATRKVLLNTATGTEFIGKIESQTLIGKLTDNARVNLTGNAETAQFQTSKNAMLYAKNYSSRKAQIDAHGNSIAWIHADDDIDVAVFDQAKVSYTGFPKEISLNEEAIAKLTVKSNSLASVSN